MTGDAASLVDERDADVLKQWQAALHRRADRGWCRGDGADRRRPRRSARVVPRGGRPGAWRWRHARQPSARGDSGQTGAGKAVRAKEGGRWRAGAFQAGAVLEQRTEHLRIIYPGRLAQRRDVGRAPRGGIRAVLEQQPERRRRPDTTAGDEERRSAIFRSCVGIGPRIEQDAQRLPVGCRPHQRGRAGAVDGVGIGSRVEQPLHERGVPDQCRGHQRRRATRASRLRHARLAA